MTIKERDKFKSDCSSHTFVDKWNLLLNMNKNSNRNCIYEKCKQMYQIKQHAKFMCSERVT
jgi:hypothetical protein